MQIKKAAPQDGQSKENYLTTDYSIGWVGYIEKSQKSLPLGDVRFFEARHARNYSWLRLSAKLMILVASIRPGFAANATSCHVALPSVRAAATLRVLRLINN